MKKVTIIIPIMELITENEIYNIINRITPNFDDYKIMFVSYEKETINNLIKISKSNKNVAYMKSIEKSAIAMFVEVALKIKTDVVYLSPKVTTVNNWLTQLYKAAYTSDNIAIVQSITNNLISSIDNLSMDSVFCKDKLVANNEIVKKNQYSFSIPIVSFECFYLKRMVLNELIELTPFMNEIIISNLITEAGYDIVISTDIIVYTENVEILKPKEEQLLAVSADYAKKVKFFYNKKILIDGLKKVIYQIEGASKPNFLIIIHDFNDIKNNLGGTSLHVYDLIKRLRDKYNFHVFYPYNTKYCLHSYFTSGDAELSFLCDTTYDNILFNNLSYEDLLSDIVETFNIKALHIHHIKGHYFNIIQVIKKYKLKTIISLHDFYSVCPNFTKLYLGKQYCEGKGYDCSKCLYQTIKLQHNALPKYQELWRKLFSLANTIIVPSENTKRELLKTYKEIEIKVVEHGIDLKKVVSCLSIENAHKYNVAFVGSLGIHKGSQVIEKLIKKINFSKIKTYLFGTCGFRRKLIGNFNFKYCGKYSRENISELLNKNKIKLVCLFSICPETYSYTLEESIASGVPVLIFDIGAGSERVKKNNLGWVIPVTDNPLDIEAEINRIFNDYSDYNNKIASINKYSTKTVSEMSNEYDTIYIRFNLKNNVISSEKLISIFVRGRDNNISDDDITFLNSVRVKMIRKINTPLWVSKIIEMIRR